ncbi:hypothetical protein TBLA_0B09790 [Henningerozyma blattae CBS 6284]|uniref:Importin subunit alpha n=1 Tax=Henningerozyma blattae (strain ATCC 34711 / CBS 6284 / DSM 70876 / NBRC 10599 / NRRL Y-10934 / UCD 77-7) TaxID=1071380 RepID=I2H093_HENB6|nr:hypothetical protein TBLA_0B09790 [Tetrapisispora blattae CBS 6284]CCH59795.1 hypothetical protein TBLA_0B09790 [Tetrapisispora blattae CBS 6284]
MTSESNNNNNNNNKTNAYRIKKYKNKKRFNHNELKRRNHQKHIETRKAFRDEYLSKRNVIDAAMAEKYPCSRINSIFLRSNYNMDGLIGYFNTNITDTTYDFNLNYYVDIASNDFETELPRIASKLSHSGSDSICSILVKLRQLLHLQTAINSTSIIRSGIIPKLVHCVDPGAPQQIQCNSICCLRIISSFSNDSISLMVDLNIILRLISLLYSTSDEIKEQSVWILGNIASNSVYNRHLVIYNKSVRILVGLLNNRNSYQTSMVRIISWTLANLCKDISSKETYYEDKEELLRIVPFLSSLLLSPDFRIVLNAARVASYLIDEEESTIQYFLDNRVVEVLINILNTDMVKIRKLILQTLVKISMGSDDQVRNIIDFGLLPLIKSSLDNKGYVGKKNTIWIISNICCGKIENIKEVINIGIIPLLIDILKYDVVDRKIEVCWVIYNCVTVVETEYEIIDYLLDQDFIRPLSDCLEISDNTIVILVLEIFAKILNFEFIKDKIVNKKIFSKNFETSFIFEKIIELALHKNKAISNLSKTFIRLSQEGNCEMQRCYPQTSELKYVD